MDGLKVCDTAYPCSTGYSFVTRWNSPHQSQNNFSFGDLGTIRVQLYRVCLSRCKYQGDHYTQSMLAQYDEDEAPYHTFEFSYVSKQHRQERERVERAARLEGARVERERERLANLEQERERERERFELEQERVKRERVERERLERERLERERVERERLANLERERERLINLERERAERLANLEREREECLANLELERSQQRVEPQRNTERKPLIKEDEGDEDEEDEGTLHARIQSARSQLASLEQRQLARENSRRRSRTRSRTVSELHDVNGDDSGASEGPSKRRRREIVDIVDLTLDSD